MEIYEGNSRNNCRRHLSHERPRLWPDVAGRCLTVRPAAKQRPLLGRIGFRRLTAVTDVWATVTDLSAAVTCLQFLGPLGLASY